MSSLPNCLVVVLVALCVAPALTQIPDFVKLGEMVQRCRQETGATNEDIQSIFLRKVPETRSGQCMLACAGESLGLMHGGSLNIEGTLAMASQLLQGRDKKIQDAVRDAIQFCAEYSDTRRAQKTLKTYQVFKPTRNSAEEGPKYPLKTLHSKSSSPNYQSIHRVRRQSENQGNTLSDPSQAIPYVAPQTQQTSLYRYPNQQYPNQQYPNQQYPNQQYPNQQYPLQNNQNNPVTQPLAQISRILDPLNAAYTYPYVQPYQQPYVQPVIVATPFAGAPIIPFRGKRSPQEEVVLTSTEITLPPEVAAQISERLRELLLALISTKEGLNSTEVTEKDAELVESVTSPPRKKRQSGRENPLESPLAHLIDRVVRNGPIHNIVQDLRSLKPNSTHVMDGSTTAGTPHQPQPKSSEVCDF